jgi:hypothetical protein
MQAMLSVSATDVFPLGGKNCLVNLLDWRNFCILINGSMYLGTGLNSLFSSGIGDGGGLGGGDL